MGRCRLVPAAALAMVLVGGRQAARAQSGPDRIVALVNGDPITEGEFYAQLQLLRAQDFIVSVNPLTLNNETAGQIALNKLINAQLYLQWAAKTKVMPTDAEVEAEVQTLKKQPNVARGLASGLFSEDLLKRDVLVDRARFNIATVAASVSPQDVETYYKAHLSAFATPERWTLEILRTSKADAMPKIQADLKAGKPFAAVAKTYSEDPRSRQPGGAVSTFSANDPTIPAELRAALKALKVGQVTEPVKVNVLSPDRKSKTTSWMLFRLVAREPGHTIPFSEAKTQAERMALLEQAGGLQTADKKIAKFRETAVIKINLPGYQTLAVPQTKPSASNRP
jgi:parvulin-like peptidyl-prolyl isomerase